jgi:deoxyribose-phosphate aldolase
VDELDFVLPVAQFLNRPPEGIIAPFRDLIHRAKVSRPAIVTKLIVETDLIPVTHLEAVLHLVHAAGFDFIKTSTGMLEGGRGATVEVVSQLNRLICLKQLPLRIKASGGIQTREQALALLQAGASRLGTSKAAAIMLNDPVAC